MTRARSTSLQSPKSSSNVRVHQDQQDIDINIEEVETISDKRGDEETK